MRGQDDPLDSAIDEVACEMTAGDASVNLRARVLADLSVSRTLRRIVLWRPAFAALSVAVVAVGLVTVMRSTVGNPASTLPSRAGTPGSPPSRAAQPRTLENPPSTFSEARSTPRTRPGTLENPFSEPPLREESIAVDPIAVTPMQPAESIAVEELPSITPIAVTPLGQGDRP